MSSFRVAVQRAAAARPATTIATRAAARSFSSSPRSLEAAKQQPSPEAKASSIIDSLPGNSLLAKTGYITVGTGLSAVAISKELYVANEETVILAGFLVFATLVGKAIAKPYGQWADGQIEVSLEEQS